MSHTLTIQVLRQRIHELRCETYALECALEREEMTKAREEFTCACVKLNSDIGVFDLGQQAERMRVGLQTGFVARTLSAWKPCPECGGTGVPRRLK